ncbi:MAG: WD40 repeat domain-containing protein [Phycisphaerae bacterium]
MRLVPILASLMFLSVALGQDRVGQAPAFSLRAHKAQVDHLAFCPTGKYIASSGEEGQIFVWDYAQQKVLQRLRVKDSPASRSDSSVAPQRRRIESIAYSPDGLQLAETATELQSDGSARVWNPIEGKQALLLSDKLQNARTIAYSPDGKWIALNSRSLKKTDDRIMIFDAKTGKLEFELIDDRVAATTLDFSPDSSLLASAGTTRLIVWDMAKRAVKHRISGFDKVIQGIDFSPDGKTIVTVTAGNSLKLWDVEKGTMNREIDCDQDGLTCVAFSMSGKTVASGGNSRTVKIWNVETGRRMNTLVAHGDKVMTLAFDYAGKYLATADRAGTIYVWDFPEETYKDQKEETKKKKDSKKPG